MADTIPVQIPMRDAIAACMSSWNTSEFLKKSVDEHINREIEDCLRAGGIHERIKAEVNVALNALGTEKWEAIVTEAIRELARERVNWGTHDDERRRKFVHDLVETEVQARIKTLLGFEKESGGADD